MCIHAHRLKLHVILWFEWIIMWKTKICNANVYSGEHFLPLIHQWVDFDKLVDALTVVFWGKPAVRWSHVLHLHNQRVIGPLSNVLIWLPRTVILIQWGFSPGANEQPSTYSSPAFPISWDWGIVWGQCMDVKWIPAPWSLTHLSPDPTTSPRNIPPGGADDDRQPHQRSVFLSFLCYF